MLGVRQRTSFSDSLKFAASPRHHTHHLASVLPVRRSEVTFSQWFTRFLDVAGIDPSAVPPLGTEVPLLETNRESAPVSAESVTRKREEPPKQREVT
jgi:hypothetical protein